MLTPKDPYANVEVKELKLSVRAFDCLKWAQMSSVGDLLNYSPENFKKLRTLVENLLAKFLWNLKIN